MNRSRLVRSGGWLRLAVVTERDLIGGVDRVRVNLRPLEQAGSDVGVGQRCAVRILRRLVAGAGIDRRDAGDVAIGVIGGLDSDIGIVAGRTISAAGAGGTAAGGVLPSGEEPMIGVEMMS